MKFENITSLFSSKNKKAAYDAASKIEEMIIKISGIRIDREDKPRELKEILESSCGLLEKLDKKLEDESKTKLKDFGKNSGFATAKISLSENRSAKSNADIGQERVAFSTKLAEPSLSDLCKRLIDLRDKVILLREEFSDYKSENIELLYRELGNILEKEGVNTIELSGKFTAESQRIVGTKSTNKEELDNAISCTVRPGYSFSGKQIRPQEVIIYVFKKEEKES